MMIKSCLASLLMKYRLDKCDATKVPIQTRQHFLFHIPKRPVYLTFEEL